MKDRFRTIAGGDPVSRRHIAAPLAGVLVAATLWVMASRPGRVAPAPLHPADIVLLGGKVVTLDAQSSIAEALAIRDGRIVAVGSNSSVQPWIGPQTRVVDLSGRTVIPGLIDSHIHAIRAGLTYGSELDWSGTGSLQEGLQSIAEAAQHTPPGTWIMVVGGWHELQFPERRGPTPAELDRVAPHHPVYVQHLYEYAVLNSKAIEALGVGAAEPDPRMGRFERGPDGRLTGIVRGDVPSFSYLFSRLPKAGSVADQAESSRRFFRRLNQLALTGVIDPAGGSMFVESYDPVYRLWKAGQLTLRIRYFVSSQRPGSEEDDYQQWARYLRVRLGDDMLRFMGFGEVLLWETQDTWGQPAQFTQRTRERVYQIARLAAERELALQIHTTHDASLRGYLDVFEQVNQEVPITHLRWFAAHLEDITEESMERVKALGMGISIQDRLYFDGDMYLGHFGAPAARRAPPIQTMMRKGLVVAAGTDAHRVSPYNPWVSLWWLVTGKSVAGTPLRGPEETPTREQALRMYTLNSAWLAGEEHLRGSLEVGKWADLAVLSRDYFAVPDDEIREIESLLTIVGGKVVYAAGPFADLES